jgi:hypothetical protein
MPRYDVTVDLVQQETMAHGLRLAGRIQADAPSLAAWQLITAYDLADRIDHDGTVAHWVARRRGVLGRGRRWGGRIGGTGGDDGLSGVREPRRPLPSAGSAAAAVDPHAAA